MPHNCRVAIVRQIEIAQPDASCILTHARGHSLRRAQKKGVVLRSSADENGYLLPGGGKIRWQKVSGHGFDLNCPRRISR